LNPAFDHIARDYDESFTHSLIGKAQRNAVHAELKNILAKSDPVKILEIGCGTGADAIELAKRGYSVHASDVSGEMIEVAKSKKEGNLTNLEFSVCDMRHTPTLESGVDLVFSNFGAVNCIAPKELDQLISEFKSKMKLGSRIVIVVITSFCLWESFYFLLKGKWHEAFRRRKKNAVLASLETSHQEVYYTSIRKLKSEHPELKSIKGIGITVPPSYLETAFSKFPVMIAFFESLDKILSKLSLTAYVADHALLEFELS
jgi:ubiquinone/menaquinone biosynthesis C-methylase UbiE